MQLPMGMQMHMHEAGGTRWGGGRGQAGLPDGAVRPTPGRRSQAVLQAGGGVAVT